MGFFESVFFEFFREKILFGDFELFFFRVAGESYDFHTVAERGGDVFEEVRSANEHDRTEIEWGFDVVVAEGMILFGVEGFKESGGWVAAQVARHFVNFVEHEDGVAGSGLFEGLDESPGH